MYVKLVLYSERDPSLDGWDKLHEGYRTDDEPRNCPQFDGYLFVERTPNHPDESGLHLVYAFYTTSDGLWYTILDEDYPLLDPFPLSLLYHGLYAAYQAK